MQQSRVQRNLFSTLLCMLISSSRWPLVMGQGKYVLPLRNVFFVFHYFGITLDHGVTYSFHANGYICNLYTIFSGMHTLTPCTQIYVYQKLF